MGSKQSVVVPPTTDFFKKLFFGKKNVETIGHFLDIWIFMAMYMDKLDQFEKNNLRTFRISWNITKIFAYVTFYFWKTGLEKPIVAIIARKYLIFKYKKSHMNGNISTDSERPGIKFFKTCLIYPYILP